MITLPVNLVIRDKACAVIGGGHIALRKVKRLLDAGGKVTVIAPEICGPLQELDAAGRIRWRQKTYSRGDLYGYWLACCAVGDREAAGEAAAEAEERDIFFNSADCPAQGSCIMPAVLRRGDLVISVSTGGNSPAAAKLIKNELDNFINEDCVRFLDRMTEFRKELGQKVPSSRERENFWGKVMDEDVIKLIRSRQFDEAEERIHHAISCFGDEP